MEATTFENVSQSDNMFNTIDSIQQRNHLLKSLLQEKWKLYEKDEMSVKQHLDTILLLSKQISAELLEKFKSAKEILQITTEIVAALHEQYHANTSHRVNTAHLNYLGKTSHFLNHVIITFKSVENSLHKVYYLAEEDIQIPRASDQSLGLSNTEHYKQNEHSEGKSREEKGSFQMSCCDSRNNQPNSKHEQQSSTTEMGSSQQDSICCNIQFLRGEGSGEEATAVTKGECLQVSNTCSAGQKGAMKQSAIQISDEIKDQHRIIKKMDCSTEVKDTDRTLRSGSVDNQDGNTEVYLHSTLETGGAIEKKINKSHDKNEVTELVKTEDTRGWSQRELLAELKSEDEPQIGCYITAPFIIAQRLLCKIINDKSSMVVGDDEELVSNLISIQCTDSRIKIPFPLKIAIPFTARYRGNYRDIMVKASDATPHSSYLTPLSLEGVYNGHKKSCADVKIYKLGIFSVMSCLRKETFTIPRKGLTLKLSMDSRITLNYLPGSFSTSVVVQSKVQPIDSTLLNVMKSRQDIFHPIISTSPLVHIKHPSTQQFRKSITITLPCPPNSDKKRLGDEIDHPRPTAAVQRSSSHRFRSVSAPVRKPGEVTNESLKLFGFKSKDEEWVMMDNVTVKDMQNGLVAIELTEHVERFIVLRLSPSVDSSYLISFVHKLEEAIQFTMVNVITYHKRDNFHHIVVLMVPSKELRWELVKLREEGFRGPPEPSEEFPMREGEQLILKFCGNIKSLDSDQNTSQGYQLIFHSQRKTRLELQLTEVNEFGNCCSPHYKGMAIFYKITKDELTKQWDREPQPVDNLDHTPVCKLTLTLPKREKVLSRSTTSVSKVPETSSEDLLYWVASEISEEDATLLVTSLRIHRSAVQLVRLTNPDDLTDQIYKLLNMWKKNMPTSVDKIQILSRHLKKCGREDLAEELRSKYSQGGPVKPL